MTRICSLLFAAALLAGCSEAGSAAAPAAKAATNTATAPAEAKPTGISAEARAAAEETFASRCTPCHGPAGAGDGPASTGLTPPPRNFQETSWQDEVSDDHIEKIVQYGGAAVGRSAAMPPNPDLKPEVIAGLREHIRNLAD